MPISYPEARLGFTGGLIAGLAARIPHKIAMEMILLCSTLEPQRAYNIGLGNKVVPTGQQVPTALAMAREMTEFSPLVMKTLKRFVTEGVLARAVGTIRPRPARPQRRQGSDDAAEATAAVKRSAKAVFKGH